MNQSEETFIPCIVDNSSVEFIVLAPFKGHDTVIVKSSNAGFDLLGFAAGQKRHLSVSLSVSHVFFGIRRKFNSIEIGATSDYAPSVDNRQSAMKFVWRGDSNPRSRKKVKTELAYRAFPLYKAVSNSNLAEVEWILAPLLLECLVGHSTAVRIKMKILTSILIFMLILTLIGVISLLPPF